MLINNTLLLNHINTYGIDETVNEIDLNLVEDDKIKIIIRTIQHSKEALLEELNKNTSADFNFIEDKTIA